MKERTGSLKRPLIYCKARGLLRPEGGWVVAEPRRKQARCTHSRLGTCPRALGAAPPTGLARVTSESGRGGGVPLAKAHVTLQSLLGCP